jgi:hypothetical protein
MSNSAADTNECEVCGSLALRVGVEVAERALARVRGHTWAIGCARASLRHELDAGSRICL